jgi:hypothetical protein
MRGEFVGVWLEMRRDIWAPLIEQENVPEDIFCELYRALAPEFKVTPTIEVLADVIDSPAQSREAFVSTRADELDGERGVVSFLEAAHEVLNELAGDPLSNCYFNLLAGFIEKYSLRYDLRRPCTLCPTLPGVLTSLITHMKSTTLADAHLTKLNGEFEEAVRDLRNGRTESRIKTCLMRQFLLIEGIANARNETTGETFGQTCRRASWPHKTLNSAAGNLYGFRSDYPGLGHAGNPKAALRDLDDRELVGVSCMLLGVLPYVDPSMNLNSVYGEFGAPTGIDESPRKSASYPHADSVWKRMCAWIGGIVGKQS